jgi:hypothetical protein
MAVTGAIATTCILVAMLGPGCSDQAEDVQPLIVLQPRIVLRDSMSLDSMLVVVVRDSFGVYLPDSLSFPRFPPPEPVP